MEEKDCLTKITCRSFVFLFVYIYETLISQFKHEPSSLQYSRQTQSDGSNKEI